MVGRKNKYDSACYYAGKKIGGCTVADGDAYVVLMNQCNYDAARVLREYAYFSPELKRNSNQGCKKFKLSQMLISGGFIVKEASNRKPLTSIVSYRAWRRRQ